MIRLVVDAARPDPAALRDAAAVIARGGIVAIPTDTLYGLAADPFNPEAVARVFAVKHRPPERAIPLIAADRGQVEQAFGPLPPGAARVAAQFWPGPLTLLVPAVPTLAAAVSSDAGRVGVRVPAHAVARELCRACGTPLTATSANVSGEPATSDPDDVASGLTDLDLLIDAGRTAGGAPSTIVDVDGDRVTLVRAGAISWDKVQACLE